MAQSKGDDIDCDDTYDPDGTYCNIIIVLNVCHTEYFRVPTFIQRSIVLFYLEREKVKGEVTRYSTTIPLHFKQC